MSTAAKLEFYLITLKPTTALSATVSADPSDPYMSISYTGGQTGTASGVGTAGAPLPGNTVVFTDTSGTERGRVRLRSWTPSGPTGTAGTLSVAENDDVTPNVVTGDSIQVLLEWRLWPIAPRLVQRGTEVEFYEDYDAGFTDQTVNWRPVAVAGPPAVAFLSGPTQVSFVGDRSFALAPGATITGYLWTAHGSAEVTSASQGTEGSPVTFTWSAAGQYLVSLRVTDSNGNAHTAYTWVFVIDPDNPSAGGGVYTRFDAANDSVDFSGGGGECSFTAHGVADVSEFPRETLVVHACRGTLTTPTGSWPFRTNVLFVGHVVGNSVRQDPVHNTTGFRAVTIDGLMKNLSMHAVSLRDEAGPRNWTMASNITVDRAASFLWLYRSTLALMTPIRPLNYAAEIKRQDFGPTDMYQQLQGELVKDAWGQVVADHQGVLHLVRDYNLMTAAERAAATTRKTLHKGLWLAPLDIEERADYAWPVRKVKMSGIYYPGDGGEPVPLFSEAPGDVHRAYGREDAPGRLILTTQADLNTRCGLALARQNMRWHTVRARFVNDGSFTVAPQEVFPTNVEAADNGRGLAWAPDLIPRRVRRAYDHGAGTVEAEVEFEPSATGPDGVTVVLPRKPAQTPTLPRWDPPPVPEWTPPTILDAGACVAADGNLGVYWSLDKGATWARRVNGLASGPTGTSQLLFRDLIWDPWRHPADPEGTTLLGCGPGFLARSDDAGKNWGNLTQFLTDPPNAWNDTPAPTAADLTFVQVHADVHNVDTFYLLAAWQNTGGAWRGWLARTADNCKTWTWQPLGGTTYDGTYYYPVRAAVFDSKSGSDYRNWDGAGKIAGEPDGEFNRCTSESTGAGTWNQIFITLDFGVQLGGIVSIGGLTRGTLTDRAGEVRGSNTAADFDVPFPGSWTASYGAGWYTKAGAFAWESTTTPNIGAGYRIWRFSIQIETTDPVGPYLDIDAARASSTSPGTPAQARPLGMDLDNADGTRLHVTYWDGTDLILKTFSAAALTLSSQYNLGAAADADVTTRAYYAFPRCPAYPGITGSEVYVIGRMAGAVAHVGLSTDAGASFSDIGDGSWTTERAAALSVDADGVTLRAFLNGSRELWESPDNGASWSLINTIPFDTESEAASRHADGTYLIGNRDATPGERAAFLEGAPYIDLWIAASGIPGAQLPTLADGAGGIVSIIWV